MNATTTVSKPRYTEEEIHRALVEVAACSGNTTMAARHLDADDSAPSIDQKTLWRWSKRDRIEDYERIRQTALPAITAQAAEQHMNMRERHVELADEALTQVKKRLPQMKDKDLINALGKADIGAGIHGEKAQLFSGQPTHIVQRDAADVLRELQAIGFKGQVDPPPPPKHVDAEVLSEETLPS